MEIMSIRENPKYADAGINYFQKQWASEESMMVYEDCIRQSIEAENALPQWYLLVEKNEIIGCGGLITNDFISRMDLYPWFCALYIEEAYRGHNYGQLLLNKAKKDAQKFGFQAIYLCTDHIGYYERHDFEFIGMGYHPWGESSRVYSARV